MEAYYEPASRMGAAAVRVGTNILMWGGSTPEVYFGSRQKIASFVEMFDTECELWKQVATKGSPPRGLIGCAYASIGSKFYTFGGFDGQTLSNCVHQLDSASLEWRQLEVEDSNTPLKKSFCGMVPLDEDKLVVFGGGLGSSKFTNELHILNLKEGVWYVPNSTGAVPPPCSDFTFTKINADSAVLFGGNHKGHGYANDVYIVNMRTWHWTKLKVFGDQVPARRRAHTAVPLACPPQALGYLLVVGGVDKHGTVLRDAWVLDMEQGTWDQTLLPEVVQPRHDHTAAVLSNTGRQARLVILGGQVELGVPVTETTLLELELSVFKRTKGEVSKWSVITAISTSQPLSWQERQSSIKDRKELQQLQREVEEVKQATELQERNFEQEKISMRIQLDVAGVTCDELKEALQSAMSDLDSSKGRVDTVEQEKASLQTLLLSSQEKVNDLSEELETTSRQFEEMQEELNMRIHNLESENKTLNQQLHVQHLASERPQQSSPQQSSPQQSSPQQSSPEQSQASPPQVMTVAETSSSLPQERAERLAATLERAEKMGFISSQAGSSGISVGTDTVEIPLVEIITPKEFESVSTTPFEKKNLVDVKVALSSLAGKWRCLGLALGLRPSTVEVIELASPDQPQQCLAMALGHWISLNYNTEVHGLPTWRKLVSVVAHGQGGDDYALAASIAEKYSGKAVPKAPHAAGTEGAAKQARPPDSADQTQVKSSDESKPLLGSSQNSRLCCIII